MNDISVLTGGRAGDGINSAGLLVAHLFNHMGYQTYMYFDYPSLIKGGHNFTITRAADQKIGAHRDRCDYLLALSQDSIDLHRELIHDSTVVLFDSGRVQGDGQGIPVEEILNAEKAPSVMGNSCIIGAFAKAAGIPFKVVETVIWRQIPKDPEKNLIIARRGYDAVGEKRVIPRAGDTCCPLLTGNEVIGLGLLHGGLDAYVAYPMTPTSNLLHFLAGTARDFPITVVHPENEIAVMLMALGFSYAGKKTAVGTSGGGFCLMTEGFSFSGASEVPVVVVMGQRTGPSTGLPTYTGQADLQFILHAGQGEFPRLVVAPGDPEQAYVWSSIALSLAWKCQVPAVILVDKTLCEGTYSLDEKAIVVPDTGEPEPAVDSGPYRRYEITGNGISPNRHPPSRDAVIKVNSYAHDEAGITTERADMVVIMTEKRQNKARALKGETDLLECVKTYGNKDASTAILCWGSTLLVCREVAESRGIRVIQPVVLSPFPEASLKVALSGIMDLISVEENADGQLRTLCSQHGIAVNHHIAKLDGRPFSVEELEARLKEAI
ncbi:MAG: 2-oxoacid:acceptor oxidoreductase family protein [Methanoregulaceae archaeon]|jgi:2-oxoglutarate ferredoxin oxidoreductase subunit alpha|nr:2-oxoacid:acceptor oxidoreductase family protein [Methanoregulaceae archaeon]MCU0628381.1 2-oxoacid:acceptor oxidoreductase family protein [Methanoregulaceae archaeon]